MHTSASTAASPAGPVVNMGSKGVMNLKNFDISNACNGATCNASSGDCGCENWKKTGVTVSNLAVNPVTITFDETYNDDDTINTGVKPNVCYPIYGTGSITNQSGVNSVSFFATGLSCGDPAGDSFTDSLSYTIVQGAGTGAWSNARGTGTFALGEDLYAGQGIFSIKGSLQKNP